MKNSRLNISMLAIVLGTVIAFTQSAFKPVHKHKFATAQWIFNGTMLSQDKSAANYTKVDATHPVPTSCSGSAVPCYITVDGDLQTYLNANSSTAIRDNADEVRD
ncbi:hypothetical protein DIU31_031480 [Mucilaginibacter rubeus]|uniref:Uncharacterized protein n=1 Tax=Mucilaginibacter rubeus TaxID=2027860 RepID=A0AAE6MLF4_9SPHI|nr:MULTISPECIES: hypothetical protein [Mucilaginibacter]QEM07803.1 hypothetical protein DIU31_031480 [Mucilaginibacter rubeus]QEM20255.1 hypothetical protein DIU38_031085 [Mucilaginibacter gossypii]QTE43027.1 hypothetical protein J3L19_29580 [Mucilaginibacter rubeus]QTE49628.1 hypothetical protein J3L21_29540 [Mucilaginibacter rubeus]QTE54723.1 hypothetical protein J3L23_21160 [Mucilaginibacter rubeus]